MVVRGDSNVSLPGRGVTCFDEIIIELVVPKGHATGCTADPCSNSSLDYVNILLHSTSALSVCRCVSSEVPAHQQTLLRRTENITQKTMEKLMKGVRQIDNPSQDYRYQELAKIIKIDNRSGVSEDS